MKVTQLRDKDKTTALTTMDNVDRKNTNRNQDTASIRI